MRNKSVGNQASAEFLFIPRRESELGYMAEVLCNRILLKFVNIKKKKSKKRATWQNKAAISIVTATMHRNRIS